VRESTGTENRSQAIAILHQKMAKAARLGGYSEQIDRVLVDQLLDLVIEDYDFNKRGSPSNGDQGIGVPAPAFSPRLQHEAPLVKRVRYFRMHRLDNARTGIVEHDQYRMLRDSLTSYGRIALAISYHTGARKGESTKFWSRTST